MRNRLEIDIWMRRKGLSVTKIQKALEFKNHGVVSDTVRGLRNNRKVLQYLVDAGCPVKYLDLPEDMKDAA